MDNENVSLGRERKFSFQLGWLSDYRLQLMGICAIGVILCHANLDISNVALPKVVALFWGLGNQGVDVFFLLSGIGMYYSLQRRDPLKRWYLKRFYAIGISYILIAAPFYIWYVIDKSGNVLDFFRHLFTIGFWSENFGAWYIAVLIPLYVITPFVGKLIDKSKRRNVVVGAIVLGVFVVCLVGKAFSSGVLNNVFARFLYTPTYFLGYGLGPVVKEKKRITWWLCPTFLILFFALTTIPNQFSFAYKVLYVPMVMILCVIIRFVYAHMRWLDAVLCWFGKRSLELYLTNIFLPFVLRAIPVWGNPWNNGNYVFYAIVIALGVLISQGVYIVKCKSQKKFEQKCHVNECFGEAS